MGNGATAVYLSLHFPAQGQSEFSALVCEREYLELVLGFIEYRKGVTSRSSINVEVMADVAVQAMANNDPRFLTGPPTLHGGLCHLEILARFTVLLVLLLRRPGEPWKDKQNHEMKEMCCNAFALFRFCEKNFGGKQAERSKLVREIVAAAADFGVAIGFNIGSQPLVASQTPTPALLGQAPGQEIAAQSSQNGNFEQSYTYASNSYQNMQPYPSMYEDQQAAPGPHVTSYDQQFDPTISSKKRKYDAQYFTQQTGHSLSSNPSNLPYNAPAPDQYLQAIQPINLFKIKHDSMVTRYGYRESLGFFSKSVVFLYVQIQDGKLDGSYTSLDKCALLYVDYKVLLLKYLDSTGPMPEDFLIWQARFKGSGNDYDTVSWAWLSLVMTSTVGQQTLKEYQDEKAMRKAAVEAGWAFL
ncbi:hypothetical protein MBM_01131 [Drepanopeziza brunnea f. sp. 'multigermtubi' MB_m1]|uniref:Uncharacterized protein n=1 Tax=Marssonina brunnea f. sp. multigermtubi (strain MB_m1) TaxID=1072389 RepID=K1Y5I1_MARBU|nr:uncharacterized protein MBM_01131 [Drepanopeziza brunnea f. sp. 'multigermtubi' MB_m1]EKD20449.1 hypothetical protein MBM_01131 [Drepanopeziza brunnea f. sp. 'multigermtubi' MB_m1]